MSVFDLFKSLETKKEPQRPVEWIVCCLGNPGLKYEGTRHNAGFMTAEILSDKLNTKINKIKFHALSGEAEYSGRRILLLQPQTYMNDSGISAGEALRWYGLSSERLIVVCDDLELAPGRLRVRPKGSAGGHNGLKSIISHVGTEEFPRVKIGIGRPDHSEFQVIDWVLGRFSPEDKKKIDQTTGLAAEAVLKIISSDVPTAMQEFNGKTAI